ncbi:NAD(P)-binding protein [Tricholoma matsutake]|nr:NAD(P)-binding protein [Tricholoma matsutake 945]
MSLAAYHQAATAYCRVDKTMTESQSITGCNGNVGKRVVTLALRRGYTVVGVDPKPQFGHNWVNSQFTFIHADLADYDTVLKVLEQCNSVIHLAACSNPGDYKVNLHNSNVIVSWNVLRAGAELKITRIAQASSVNVLALVFSLNPQYEYFPLDELHPCLPDEPYGVSKGLRAAIVGRYSSTRIASIRLHRSSPNHAFLLAVTDESSRWSGHEAFFIGTAVLRQKYWERLIQLLRLWESGGAQRWVVRAMI